MKPIHLFFLTLMMISLAACKKNNNPSPGPGPGPGPNPGNAINISSTSPEFIYWGEELTITGTNFSSNKNDYQVKFLTDASCTDTFQTVIYAATNNLLKIKTPIATYPSGKKCGPTFASVIVTLNGKSDTAQLKMVGWPQVQSICNHFGVPDPPGLGRTGDSLILDVVGATGVYASNHPNQKNFQLSINDTVVNYTWRPVCNGRGAGIVIPVEKFASVECGSPGYRSALFKVSIPGTQIFDTARMNIYFLPRTQFTDATGPATVSKLAGGNPEWNYYGSKMFYNKIRFIPENCASQTIEIPALVPPTEPTFYTHGFFYIPLSVMLAPCKYRILAVTPCNSFQLLGFVQVNP